MVPDGVGKSSGYDFSILFNTATVHWCPGPDDEVLCPIVLGKVVVVVLVMPSQYPSYSYSALVQASLKCPMVVGGERRRTPTRPLIE